MCVFVKLFIRSIYVNAFVILSSSSDPILTAFELSWELRRLSRMETEFRTEYNVIMMCIAI